MEAMPGKLFCSVCLVVGVSLFMSAKGAEIPSGISDRISGPATNPNLSDERLQVNGPRIGCTCIHFVCHCCANASLPMKLPKVQVCVRMTYIPEEYKVDFALYFDEILLLNKTAPVYTLVNECVGVKGYTQVCLQSYNMKASKVLLSGCLRLYITFPGNIWFYAPIGCFRMIPEDTLKKEKLLAAKDSVLLSQDMKELIPAQNSLRSKPLQRSGNGCQCVKMDCGCCQHFDIPKIKLNDTACINITYLPSQYGISVTFSIDGKVWVNETISARNPPPICFAIPHLKKLASICLEFYNLDYTEKTFSGCLNLTARLAFAKVETVHVGCFEIPLPRKAVDGRHTLLWTPLTKARLINKVSKKEDIRKAFMKVFRRIAVEKDYPVFSVKILKNN